jgi:hypothetical protein
MYLVFKFLYVSNVYCWSLACREALLSIAEIGKSLRWDWEFIGRRQPRHQASTGTREGTPLRHGRM